MDDLYVVRRLIFATKNKFLLAMIALTKYYSSKHYMGLDAMRGIAAVAVVLYHCSSRLNVPFLFPHGYLAVDFFFTLSGFVIAQAYQERIVSRKLSIMQFVIVRAIRLLPMIMLGTLLAAVIEIGRPGITDQGKHLSDTMMALISGLFLFPTLKETTLEYTVFPLNGPSWSLFFEISANAIFAVWAWTRLGLWALVPLLGCSMLGVLSGAIEFGKIDFGIIPSNFTWGFGRVGWSFTIGLILFRVRDHALHVPFLVSASILLAILLMPNFNEHNAIFDCVSVFIVFPLIVMSSLAVQFENLGKSISIWCGALSYPIYALHYPIVRVFAVIGTALNPPMAGRLGMSILATVLALSFSAIVYIFIETPIRAWLTSKFLEDKTS